MPDVSYWALCRSKFADCAERSWVFTLFRDSRDRRDLSLKVCWTLAQRWPLAVWLMTQQLRCDVNEADEAEQRSHPYITTRTLQV